MFRSVRPQPRNCTVLNLALKLCWVGSFIWRQGEAWRLIVFSPASKDSVGSFGYNRCHHLRRLAQPPVLYWFKTQTDLNSRFITYFPNGSNLWKKQKCFKITFLKSGCSSSCFLWDTTPGLIIHNNCRLSIVWNIHKICRLVEAPNLLQLYFDKDIKVGL